MEKITAHGMMKTTYKSIDIELEFKLYNKSILAILGPSGSGKTSFLKYLAGLERPNKSKLTVNNQCWQDSEKGFFKPPHSRRIGYVLQDAILFPHLSIKENILFGYKRIKKHLRKVHFHDIVSLLKLEKIIQSKPKNLSGGESQRVCIARALLTSPELLIMDEPINSLDIDNKMLIFNCIETIKNIIEIPIIYVTHSWHEAIYLADYIMYLKDGKIHKTGPANVIKNQILDEATENFKKYLQINI